MIEIDLPYGVLEAFTNLSANGVKTIMKDLSIIEEQETIKSIADKFIDTSCFHYGNLFNHTQPFAIHSDVSIKKESILLIPIHASVEQKFIVFDQTVESTSEISWIYNIFDDKSNEELKEMYYDSSIKSRPCDTNSVKGCTRNPVSNSLHKFLPYTKELYHGLTGIAWNYTPGKALLFPANRIHATGRMSSSKIGCTIQFTDSVNNLLISASTRILS